MSTLDFYHTYRRAIIWIAYNDDPGSSHAFSVKHVSQMVSVVLVADIFGKTPEQVAKAVVRRRKEEEA